MSNREKIIRNALIVVLAAFGFVWWADREPDEFQAKYCWNTSGAHPTLYQKWVGGREVTLSNAVKFAWCEDLRKNGVLGSACEVKQAWLKEKFRHEDEEEKIKGNSVSFGNMVADGEEVNFDSIRDGNRKMIFDMVCKFRPPFPVLEGDKWRLKWPENN